MKTNFTFLDIVNEAEKNGKVSFYWSGIKHNLKRANDAEDDNPSRFYLTKERLENYPRFLCVVDGWNENELMVYDYLFNSRVSAVINVSDISLTPTE
jgi:hypothetical protein